MIYRHSESVDSIRNDKEETRLIWKWNISY